MRTIDLTDKLERKKYSRVSYITIYLNKPFIGFLEGGEMSTGITFIRKRVRGGIYTHRNGSPRWYFGSDTVLSKALTNLRQRYGLKVKSKGWEKVRIKIWNFSPVEEVAELL